LAGSVLKISEFLNIPCTTEFAQEIGEKCSFDNLKKNRIDPTAFLSSGVKTSLFRKGNVSIFSLYTISNIYNPSKEYYIVRSSYCSK
jgi:hypothetical protein